jgi:enterochelin esterase-like enzyme
MRHFLKWFGGIGLLMLSAGCLSTPQSLPQDIPTLLVPATPTHAPTEQPLLASPQRSNETQIPTPQETGTFAADSTPSPDETPETLKTREADSCHAPASQLSVSYVDSSVLARRVPYSLYLPPCYVTNATPLYPVLYLLHGANTDHTQWPDLQVQPNADALIARGAIAPLVVVMPGGDYRQGEDYASFVLRDLIPHIEQTFRVAPDRKDRAIGGISQGGYWALELALAHPDLFSAVGGHSPATGSGLTDLLPSNRVPESNTLRIYLDVGDEDPLASGVAAFAATLQAHGLAPILHIYPGAHNRPYWRSHTGEYLAFYAAGW